MLRSVISVILSTIMMFVLLFFSPAILLFLGTGLALIGKLIGLAMHAKPFATGMAILGISFLYGVKHLLETKN